MGLHNKPARFLSSDLILAQFLNHSWPTILSAWSASQGDQIEQIFLFFKLQLSHPAFLSKPIRSSAS
jgi:hypothetical protein